MSLSWKKFKQKLKEYKKFVKIILISWVMFTYEADQFITIDKKAKKGIYGKYNWRHQRLKDEGIERNDALDWGQKLNLPNLVI